MMTRDEFVHALKDAEWAKLLDHDSEQRARIAALTERLDWQAENMVKMVDEHTSEQRAEIERLRGIEEEYNMLTKLMRSRGAELLEKLGYIPDLPDGIVRVYAEVDTLRARVAELEARLSPMGAEAEASDDNE